MGPVGTGKTHLSQALGMLACQRNRKVRFIRSNELLNEFYRSRADFTYDTLFKRYTKLDIPQFGIRIWWIQGGYKGCEVLVPVVCHFLLKKSFITGITILQPLYLLYIYAILIPNWGMIGIFLCLILTISK